MIRVQIDLISAITGKTTVLGRATICNNVRKTAITNGSLGDYEIVLYGRGGKRIYREGILEDFPRKKKNAWWLLHQALNQVLK